MIQKSCSTVERLTQAMLARIRDQEWPVGSLMPGERVLMEEFGVSRIALREALSHLRALGLLDTEHGRGSVIRPVDSTVLTQLFPLMLSLDGEKTIDDMFDLRLALESRTAHLAALRRSDTEVAELDRLAALFRDQLEGALEDSIVTDMEFHMAIARATHNPLFPQTLGTITEFVKHVHTMSHAANLEPQVSSVVSGLHENYVRALDCTNDPVRRYRAVLAHDAIAEAIRDRDPDRARVEMEAHLRYSVLRINQDRQQSTNRTPPAGPPLHRFGAGG